MDVLRACVMHTTRTASIMRKCTLKDGAKDSRVYARPVELLTSLHQYRCTNRLIKLWNLYTLTK